MPVKVVMPQLGESVDEGTVSKWLKARGDSIEEYEPLLEINTDKVDSEIPSPAAGRLLEILVPEGTTVKAGDLLAWIGDAGESVDSEPAGANGNAEKAAASQPPQSTGAAPVGAPGRGSDLGFISPVVARIAREQNVDLAQVPGSGLGGRITKKDALAYLDRRQTAPAPAPAPELSQTSPAPVPAHVEQTAPPTPAEKAEAARPAAPAAAVTAAQGQDGELLPLSPVRRTIAEHMVFSKHTSPHVTTVMEADLSRVVAHRQAHKEAFARDGAHLTFTPYFIAAIVAALKAYPLANSSWTEAGIRLHREINIGMATSLGEAGLIVPVIKHADGLSLLGLARSVNDLAQRARARQLKPDEVRGGTFTLTNHGISGSLFATPIINQPQCGILGVGAIQKRVVVIDDAIAIRPMAYISLTFDHRILDGASADTFLSKVVEYLQHWSN